MSTDAACVPKTVNAGKDSSTPNPKSSKAPPKPDKKKDEKPQSKNPEKEGKSEKKPVMCIVIGMAGSGKTTLMQRLNATIHEKNVPGYIINLDPAVVKIPYSPNIDIRETVKYKEIMKQYTLGPNGGIITALNLFSTRFGQVMGFLDKRAKDIDYCFIDTPGQIEVFTWSASGEIITNTLASSFPTVLVYVIDTPRTVNPVTFMSNMTYACSIMYKSQLPFVIVFNKTDVVSHRFAEEWMTDFDAFEKALRKDSSYMSTFTRSMSLVLEEFYKNIRTVGISAATGMGIDKFFTALDAAAQEYEKDYKPMIEERKKRIAEKKAAKEKAAIDRIKKDMHKTRGRKVALDARKDETRTEPVK